MRVLEKTTENSEKLGQQVRPGNEPGISRLPFLNTEPLHHLMLKELEEN